MPRFAKRYPINQLITFAAPTSAGHKYRHWLAGPSGSSQERHLGSCQTWGKRWRCMHRNAAASLGCALQRPRILRTEEGRRVEARGSMMTRECAQARRPETAFWNAVVDSGRNGSRRKRCLGLARGGNRWLDLQTRRRLARPRSSHPRRASAWLIMAASRDAGPSADCTDPALPGGSFKRACPDERRRTGAGVSRRSHGSTCSGHDS